ncbi:MAG: ClC family H(+)/Cl(-) exchange transporter, partial [Fusobacteriaceae bacterium]
MKRNLGSENNIKFLQKENSSLYFICLLIGLATGLTVSIYRYGLQQAEHLRNMFFSHKDLINPLFLL